MNYITDVKLHPNGSKHLCNVIIEIPKGTNEKFELIEPAFEIVGCVRKVHGKYPFYYGCFPETYAGDKDPLDMILLTNNTYKQLSVVEVEIVGVIRTIDNGEQDDKIIVKPTNEIFSEKDYNRKLKKMMHFLKRYKGFHSNMVLDKTMYGPETAKQLIKDAHQDYASRLPKPRVNIQ